MRILHITDAVALMRPSHWVKNLLVFAPVFFGGALSEAGKIGGAAAACGAFCLVAGGGYALNDATDAGENALHPEKRNRPLARGKITRRQAILLGCAAMGAGIAIAAAGSPEAVPVIGLYALLSAAYSAFAKRIPVVEMMFFPAFYLARIFAGGLAADIAISRWLTLCVIFMSMFLITMKRSAESGRREYPKEFIASMVPIFAASALMSYGLYCVLAARSPQAIYSIFFPIAGVMRYIALAAEGKAGGNPERTVIRDPFIAGTVAVWVMWMYILIYGI